MASSKATSAPRSTPYDMEEMYEPRSLLLAATNKLSTNTNQLSSPPLRMPAEVRNCIYEYAFPGCVIAVENPTYHYTHPRKNNTPLRILETCHQIRHEAFDLLWRHYAIDSHAFGRLNEPVVSMGPAICERITILKVHEDAVKPLYVCISGGNRSLHYDPPCFLSGFLALRRVSIWRGGWAWPGPLSEERLRSMLLACLDKEGIEIIFEEGDSGGNLAMTGDEAAWSVEV